MCMCVWLCLYVETNKNGVSVLANLLGFYLGEGCCFIWDKIKLRGRGWGWVNLWLRSDMHEYQNVLINVSST